ncbi:RfeC [Arthroderma uncinatum]|uniref:RfeC n=1 Tax=Arthroderma uncinatum TaxID=74035 RepID=UPI00144A58D7|nr:RfeC [Arthroderma uncinatum]KAF3482948.1 RfeC [Arthroderma uncinatum]
MDPNLRPQVSRPASASIPPQGPPPLSHLHQYQVHSPYQVPQPHTLPPLQHPQSHSPMPSYLGQPFRNDMPRYPVTSAHDVYAASTAPMASHAPVNSLPPASFLGQHQQQQQFPSHGLLPPTTGPQAYPQPIAPAPPRDRRHEYGMPGGPFTGAEDKGPMWTTADGMPPTTAAFAPKDAPRTQVVGSQGRRGILPSVPGRAAITNGVNGTAKGTAIPAKDADGKFPCPHCNKTYLHAKHLKRHLLRHTGDRPYMCVLCKDTFSRSDILKRHFQKCSLRRGNPTGISHLSHPHAHLKKAQAAGVVPKPVQGDVSSPISLPNGIGGTTFGEAPVNGHGVTMAPSHQPRFAEHQSFGYPMPAHASVVQSGSNGLTRGPSDHQVAAGAAAHYPPHQQQHQRTWMADPKHNSSSFLMQSGTDSVGQPTSIALPPIDAKIPSDNKQAPPQHQQQPQHPQHPQQQQNIDWTTVLQPGSHENYMPAPVYPTSMTPVNDGMHAHVDADRKYYPATTTGQQENGGLNGLYLASTSLSGDGGNRSAS